MRNEDFLEQESDVRGKTMFPGVAKLILNEVVLYPFHLLQMTFRHHPASLGIYCEMVLRRSG